MDTLSHYDCDCWRLTEPLGSDDPLPDHVCFETELGNIRAAMRDGVLPFSNWWPAQIDEGSPVRFVLRQWAEDEQGPNPTLARALAGDQRWGLLVSELQGGLDRLANDDAGIAAELQDRGLPATPAAIKHLRAVAAGKRAPYPVRGVLVTTMVRTIPPHSWSVSGQPDTTTHRLIETAVARIVHEHQAFVADVVGLHGRAFDLRAVAFEDSWQDRKETDYEAAAWEERGLLLDPFWRREHNKTGRGGLLTEYLTYIYKLVYERRRGAGLPTVPRGWRDRVRPPLQEWLDSRR